MDEFYAQRIQAEIERIAECPDEEKLGVTEQATEEQIIHAYETHLKNLGMNRCGYSPETRDLARSLFGQLREAAARLGVQVQSIDETLGAISEPPPTNEEEEAEFTIEDGEQASPSYPVIVGESSSNHPIPGMAGSGEHTIPPQQFLPTPAGPVAPLMSAGSGPNSSVPMSRVGSPPFPMPLPRALTPTPMPIFPPGAPLSPGMSPMNNGSYAPMMGSQAWPALGSFPPQPHPAFEALQKRAELAENQLSQG